MQRRGFLGALATIALAGRAALDKLAELSAPVSQEQWPLGLMDLAVSTSVHHVSPSPHWDASLYDHTGGRLDRAKVERAIGAIREHSRYVPPHMAYYLNREGRVVRLSAHPERDGLL